MGQTGAAAGLAPVVPDAADRSEPPWGLLTTVLPAAGALFSRMRAIDLAYHVRAGLLTLDSGSIVRSDPFAFSREGLPWLNQQWGAQAVFAVAHRLLGWTGVALAYAAAVGTGFGLLYRSCRRAGAASTTAGVLTLGGFLVTTVPVPRPQVLAVPLFTGTWLVLARRDRWTWLVPLLALVWANVHGSFVLAPILVAFALADDVMAKRSPTRTSLVLLATVAATLVTPFGPTVWGYAIDIVSSETIRHSVAEWRPPSPIEPTGAPFWLSGLVVVGLAFRRRREVRPVDAARLLVFFALGVPATRGTLWWALAAPPVVAGWFASDAATVPKRRRLDASAVVAGAVILALIPIALWLRTGTDRTTGSPLRLGTDAPQVLVDATRRALPAGSRLLVYQPFASWFEFAAPEYTVMVDSRVELYPDRLWRDYQRAVAGEDGWDRVLDRYGIDGVVLSPRNGLADRLRADERWRAVADGGAGSVHVRA